VQRSRPALPAAWTAAPSLGRHS